MAAVHTLYNGRYMLGYINKVTKSIVVVLKQHNVFMCDKVLLGGERGWGEGVEVRSRLGELATTITNIIVGDIPAY